MTTGSNKPDDLSALIPDPSAFGATEAFINSRPTREPAPDAAFSFGATTLGGADVRVVAAYVREALGETYEAVVDLCTADPSADFGALLGARAALDIQRGPRARRVCGVVRRVERLDSWGGRRRARAVMVPGMWALSQRVDSRIFQGLDTLEIVRAVFGEAGLDAPTLETRREYPKREYCVQYRETDLAFVTRLLEEEGIVLYFRHEGDAETVVLTDAASYGLCPTIDRRPVPFSPPQSEQASVEVVQRLDLARELRATGFMGRDYDFTRPLASIDMTRSQPRGDQGGRPRYEYPGRFTPGPYDEGSHTYGAHDGTHRVDTRQGEERALEGVGTGAGNVTGFMPGRVFQLVGHEHADLDQRYLIVRVEHHLRAPEELLSEHDAAEGTARGQDRYRNEFQCIPASVPYVPARRTPRPMVLAAQTAVVTGKGDEEIHVDAHGRIKVQFHWDRKGRHDDQTSCWMRVSQNWAGAGWGIMFIPRVGMEVVVTFLEGDPDRPLVTGCVYNGVNRPPYELPAEKTKSTIKSVSSPGGHGFNELRFEDLKGSEEIFLHAQKDFNEIVNHDHSLTVWNDERIYIKGHQYLTIEGSGPKPSGMQGPGHGVKITGEYNIDASGNVGIKSGATISLDAKGDVRTTAEASTVITSTYGTYLNSKTVYVTGKDKVVIGSDTEILLQVGGSSIKISPGGIDIASDAAVTVNGKTLKMGGTASAGLSSSGVTDVSGTPLQLNGPGLFAGRVTEFAPATITTGAALVLVGGASFPYPVVKNDDGSIQVGDHITIMPSDGTYTDFQARVLRDLGIMSQTPSGAQRLENIQNNPNGHNVTIREYNAADAAMTDSNGNPFGPDNSYAAPTNGDPNARGPDADGNFSPGPGSDVDIHYNPDIQLGPPGEREPADAVLFHELGHADHDVNGVARGNEPMAGYTDREDWQNIQGGVNEPGGTQAPGTPRSPTENEYLGDRNYPYRRTDHGSGYATPDGRKIQ